MAPCMESCSIHLLVHHTNFAGGLATFHAQDRMASAEGFTLQTWIRRLRKRAAASWRLDLVAPTPLEPRLSPEQASAAIDRSCLISAGVTPKASLPYVA